MRSVLLGIFLFLTLAAPVRAQDLLVFAAVSLNGPLDEAIALYEAETGAAVTVSYGASSTLARQIMAGAPADVVMLANRDWMAALEADGHLLPGTMRDLLTNRLVLVGGAGADPVALQDLPGVIGDGRLALALTEAVPAGIYARQAMVAAGVWDALAPRVVASDNVRTAQALVAMGAAQYGIVYATDVALEPRVRVLDRIDDALHDPIDYPIAVTARGRAAAEAFVAAMAAPPARAVFEAAGFGTLP